MADDRYTVISHTDIPGLIAVVNNKVAQGFDPLGGIIQIQGDQRLGNQNYFMQSMFKPMDPVVKAKVKAQGGKKK